MPRPRRSNRNPSNQDGQVRIIAGQYRGRKLPVRDLAGLRPTTDRVKETLFNWLQGEIPEARVLDCFAGAGALGFEALSRHAEQVILVELDKNAARQLEDNLARLGSNKGVVVQADVLQYLAGQAATPMDLVFVDPPFRKGLAEDCLRLLAERGWLAEGAWIYLETESESPAQVPAGWRLHREIKAGQVLARLYQRESQA
ncbi:16S rRNA (guanine(966)-N(2))-methyltransferase RsmD [Gallaecimonas sp. GXIMD4217]|uniref:16S rRNA (guanine(966)-N(2))-methyltransferase RsmD n=1 Tax=Gallaecimonas sp. GXIMD4217 TaxID=3131927 RepID=UPI00311AFFDF